MGLRSTDGDENGFFARGGVAHTPRLWRCVRIAVADTADYATSAPPRSCLQP